MDGLVDVDEFRAWVTGSHVVDEDGMPLCVHHGTHRRWEHMLTGSERLARFDRGTGGLPASIVAPERERIAQLQGAVWFTGDEAIASDYADQLDGERAVVAGYLALRNPLDLRIERAGLDDIEQIVGEAQGRPVSIDRTYGIERGVAQAIGRDNASVVAWARAAGYDGVIHPDTCVRGRSLHTSYVAFEPDQFLHAHQVPDAVIRAAVQAVDAHEGGAPRLAGLSAPGSVPAVHGMG
jgi:hypothetical protein